MTTDEGLETTPALSECKYKTPENILVCWQTRFGIPVSAYPAGENKIMANLIFPVNCA